MTDEKPNDGSLEKYRSYLTLQAKVHLHPMLRAKIGASDLVQETMFEAYRDRAQIRGQSPGEELAWLKKILSHNLANAVRDFRRLKRDVGREKPLERAVEDTCVRVESWLKTEQESPSEIASGQERLLAIASSMDKLPESWQEALVLRYWQGLSMNEIAKRMERSPAAVAGLLHRGLAKLRTTLEKLEG